MCSISKSYGLPGIRQGWITTRSAELAERFLAAKEQIVICGSALDEAVASAVLARRDELLPPIREAASEHSGWCGWQTVSTPMPSTVA